MSSVSVSIPFEKGRDGSLPRRFLAAALQLSSSCVPTHAEEIREGTAVQAVTFEEQALSL